MTTPNLTTQSWKPSCRADIAGKERLYKTARITASGECISLLTFDEASGSFLTQGHLGVAWFNWRELDSFCL